MKYWQQRIAVIITAVLIFISHNTLASDASAYVLGAGDSISISVYDEEELSMDLMIDASGQFEYPYLGTIMAAGMTVHQLRQAIHDGLRGDYLILPKVRVNVTSFRQFFVNGEVKKPGGYEYQPGLTVDKAIALAGGFTDRANRNSIEVTSTVTLADKVTRKAPLTAAVKPGDIIVIDDTFF
ncbi:polysaccharide export protein [Vibrio sp. SM6]|uniref:Polysaccharide export protein n=1 Tax=Vibrio agarilyticus TaxID=2726741 RepID=A0A7X8TTR8_9VIBR|nr:polysaccharide biosynthesis/export family protein [Vibrio agarilyticus]NLS14387.1 polysaccharide export protein [Vibrio agarilyticus]